MISFLRGLDPDFVSNSDSDDDDSDDNDSDNDSNGNDGKGEEDGREESLPPRLYQDTTTFLDLGTGNGSLLFGLRDAGFKGQMLGVDYSPKSVEFARQIARSRRRDSQHDVGEDEAEAEADQEGEDEDEEDIEFREYDILNGRPESLLPGKTTTTTTKEETAGQAQNPGWDVILDKGTFDAISLYSSSAVPGEQGTRRPNEGYKAAVLPLVREGGLFLITSCNWTEDELARWFEGDFEQDQQQWCFKQVGKVNYPTFSFGGVKGQTISTLCFTKVKR